MSFSPVLASDHIYDKYKRYLRTIFSIDNENYNQQFHKLLEDKASFAKGPYLEVQDSFEKGKSVAELIDEGMLPKDFRKIGMPQQRPLYKHQEVALRKAAAGANLVVSTGTGSGKTESFMIPILAHIIWEHEDGKLTPGVRALLIYPMNALANDQVERLRILLADYPQITYGSYTGQTKHRYQEALADYLELNDGKKPLPNELISRDQMKETPPHLLITNYAMLEYLMVRPGDNILFSGEYADYWKYIVLDEAHVYNGGSGIEVAMLLRRLKATLQNDSIQYFLTSATLGSEDSNQEVADFGKNLCDCDFRTENIIRAYRQKPVRERESLRLPISFYSEIASMIHADIPAEKINQKIRGMGYPTCPALGETCYDLILHDENYADVRRILSEGKDQGNAETVMDVARAMRWSSEQVFDFVTVASKAVRSGARLFDARYHMFLRATESVFITLPPSGKVFLTRKKTHTEVDGTDYKVFEIATCNVCHAIYLIGNVKNDFYQQSSFKDEDDLHSVFLLKNQISDNDEDHSMKEEEIEAEEYEICARCGFVRKRARMKQDCCEHGDAYMVKAFKVHVKGSRGILTKCPACENTNSRGMLRMFFSGQEAVTSVVGTSLFEELPSYKVSVETRQEEDDDGFGFAPVMMESKTSEAKQFIAFSDSRQAAAFYASYLDRTYRNILYKRLIVETLKNKNITRMPVPDFVEELAGEFGAHNINAHGSREAYKEAWKAVLQEIVDNNGNTSMCSIGLIGFSLDPQNIPPNGKFNLSQEDVTSLCNVLISGMLSDNAVYYDYSMPPADKEFYTYNGVEYSYTLSEPDNRKYIRSFIPRFTEKTNKRADYLMRVLAKGNPDMDQSVVNRFLEAIWTRILRQYEYLRNDGGKYQVDTNRLMIVRPEKWYICSKCKRITPFNVRNVCPGYQCEGQLLEIEPSDMMKENHYYRLYQELDIRKLRVVEHTAQLDKMTAYDYQKMFKKKEIDILSCSTTFEMGVDVGSLETVFMRNMPPSPANYAQRAGRAGRSLESAAYALTFCNKSNHDFSYFTDPVRMIRGRIDPPRFEITNEKIAIRHIYASALAFFWREHEEFFATTTRMLEPGEDGVRGIDAFKAYLEGKPENLRRFLLRFLPQELAEYFKVNSFGWVEHLFNDNEANPGALTKADDDYQYETGVLDEAREEAFKNNHRVDGYTERLRVYRNEDILSFMSRKNVMPKYGFPVDTVEMGIVGESVRGKLGLQLSRDLSLAISEYAPGSQIVANGNLITSRYIKKIPKLGWKMYDYIRCECNTLNIEVHAEDKQDQGLSMCKTCGKVLDSARKRTFLVPGFGFLADGDKIEKPGLKRPEKTYRGEVSYVGFRKDINMERFEVENSVIEIAMTRGDEMAVLNESNFFVCRTCGYTDLDETNFRPYKKMKHRNSGGFICGNDTLKRFSLGYRFETDVFQLRFIEPELVDQDTALSLLYALIRGACLHLNIEEDDIAGCIQYFYNRDMKHPNWSIVLYDKTPGGAGHVRRLYDKEVLKQVFHYTFRMLNDCTCGGDDKDASCYACLRNYYNQKYHDRLSRGKAISFFQKVFVS